MRLIPLLLALVFLNSSAASPNDDQTKGRCASADDARIPDLIARLQFADTALPGVPPEEAAYYDKEGKAIAALSEAYYAKPSDDKIAQINHRSEALHARPLFDVWIIHADLDKAMKQLSGIVDQPPFMNSYTQSVEGSRFARANTAMFHVNTYVFAMHEWLTVQRPGQENLTRDQRSKMYLDLTEIQYTMLRYMDCKVAKIMVVKP